MCVSVWILLENIKMIKKIKNFLFTRSRRCEKIFLSFSFFPLFLKRLRQNILVDTSENCSLILHVLFFSRSCVLRLCFELSSPSTFQQTHPCAPTVLTVVLSPTSVLNHGDEAPNAGPAKPEPRVLPPHNTTSVLLSLSCKNALKLHHHITGSVPIILKT